MSQALITAGLVVAAVAYLADIAAVIRRSDRPAEHQGATGTWSPVAELVDAEECEIDAEEQVVLDAATDRIAATVAAAAAEMPATLAPSAIDVLRTLTPRWHDLVQTPEQPPLFADLTIEPHYLLPIVPGRPYVSRHHDDTVSFVAQAYRMPEQITNRALAAFVHGQAVPDGV